MEELLTDNSTKPLQRKNLNWKKALRIELLPNLPNKSRTRREFVAAHKLCKQDVNPVTKSPRVNLHWFRQCSRPIHIAHKKPRPEHQRCHKTHVECPSQFRCHKRPLAKAVTSSRIAASQGNSQAKACKPYAFVGV